MKSEAIPIRQNAMTTAEMSGRKRAIMDEELTDKRATTSKKGLTLFASLTKRTLCQSMNGSGGFP